MKSPWKSLRPLEAGQEYVVLASSIPPLRHSSTARLFRGASTVRKQLATTEGVVGFSLEALPLAKQYRTLSVWLDEAALAAFASAKPHGALTKNLAPEMGPTRFVRWTIDGANGPPTWAEATRRLV
ncbi:MAG: hypothetical protein ACRD2W_15910 [Acidimicrobiales bacterium]